MKESKDTHEPRVRARAEQGDCGPRCSPRVRKRERERDRTPQLGELPLPTTLTKERAPQQTPMESSHAAARGQQQQETSAYMVLRAQQLLTQLMPTLVGDRVPIAAEALNQLHQWSRGLWGHPIQLVRDSGAGVFRLLWSCMEEYGT